LEEKKPMKEARGGSNLKPAIILTVFIATLTIAGCGKSTPEQPKPGAPAARNPNQKNPTAVIETDLGTIKIELFENEAPKTAENFRLLAERGLYNGVVFHRIVNGFMIQGGDPTGTGTGGQTADGGRLPNEINVSSPLYQGGYKRGEVAMANKGRPETATSQFFVMHGDRPLSQLPPNYTIFGRVTEGMNVVDKIASAPTAMSANGENSRPVTPVKMTRVYIQ
jgi:cyclophilin family peptidyl-prolyl cis-trans isomerase